MKSYLLAAAAAGVFLFAGCETDTSSGAAVRTKERGIRAILDSRSPSGTSLSDDIFKQYDDDFETLRTRGVTIETLRQLEQFIRQDIEATINNAIVPVYTKAFTDDEIAAIAEFLFSAAGKEFVLLSRRSPSTTEILQNSEAAVRPQIREFFLSPAGRKYLSTSSAVYQESRRAIQQLWALNSSQRTQQIDRILRKETQPR